MATTKRQKMKPKERRPSVARLYLEGKTQAAIAEEFGVTQATISRDLSAIQEEWLASSLRDFDEARAQELAKIDNLELTYWEGWQRSLQPKRVEGGRTVVDDDGERTEANFREEGRDGNVQFLNGVQWCIERRCKLLGLDRLEKLEADWIEEAIELLKRGELTPQDITQIAPDDAPYILTEAGYALELDKGNDSDD